MCGGLVDAQPAHGLARHRGRWLGRLRSRSRCRDRSRDGRSGCGRSGLNGLNWNADCRCAWNGWRGRRCRELLADHSVGEFGGFRAANGTGDRHRHAFIHRFDFELKSCLARALDLDFHLYGLGFSRTTFGPFVNVNADCEGLDWTFPSQNITLPPYLL